MPHALIWLRQDLRLDDHAPLQAALRAGLAPVFVHVHAPREAAPWAPGAASRWWLHHSLAALSRALADRGSRLLIRRGDSGEALAQLASEVGAEAVFWQRATEPAAQQWDEQVARALRRRGLRAEGLGGALLVEPDQVHTQQGDPYRVFTPFWRAAQAAMPAGDPWPAPDRLPMPPATLASDDLDALGLLPRLRWDAGLAAAWQPGEAGAQARLSRFLADGLADYAQRRDLPAEDGSSRLSPHLHFGELSPRRVRTQVLAHVAAHPQSAAGAEVFLREIGWREFAQHLLHHFPHTPTQPLHARFAAFPWREDAAALAAWQQGRTGIPMVDAGMRQLWHSGWMHNRVRMLVAALLTKHLRLHWLHGARWFWDTLVDADLGNNTLGWQWSAGCGADAAPYFRIFNPVTQGQRFDADGAYVARWVPELAALPPALRHAPWQATPIERAAAGLDADSVYARPLIDLAEGRAQALAAFRALPS